jgi:hypothetical protein
MMKVLAPMPGWMQAWPPCAARTAIDVPHVAVMPACIPLSRFTQAHRARRTGSGAVRRGPAPRWSLSTVDVRRADASQCARPRG